MKLKKLAYKAYKEAKIMKNRIINVVSNPTLVLIYHRVNNLQSDPQLLAVSPDNFYQQMKFIKANYEVLRFEEEWRECKGKSVVITFDDGYEDNYTQALPILSDLKVPATFFISSGILHKKNYNFWWDELESLILNTTCTNNMYTFKEFGFDLQYPTNDFIQIKKFYNEIHRIILNSNSIKIQEALMDSIRIWANKDSIKDLDNSAMNIEQLRQMSKSRYVTIGAHTVNHLSLGSLSLNEQREEITNSIKDLNRFTGLDISTFSYPFGTRSDYTNETIDIIKSCNIKKCAANFSGTCRGNTDIYQIPRNLVRNWDLSEFKRNLQRYWNL